jgi:ethanolamine kinase
MSPQAYIQAREQIIDWIEVDGRPYLPFQSVNTSDIDSVRKAATRIFVGEASWKEKFSTEKLQGLAVEPVLGGNTNMLFRVTGLRSVLIGINDSDSDSNLSILPDSCLVRVFGGEGMIDRDEENCVFAALAKANLSPPYWGRFANGRVEGWMERMRPLNVPELSDPVISIGIAEATARMHTAFHMPQKVQDYLSATSANGSSQEASMWPQLKGWLQQAIASTFKTENDSERADELKLPQLQEEIQWLKESVIPANTATVFCHNDLLNGNILYDDDAQLIQLIDFEYGGLNYQAFDIANHFNEFAGGTDTSVPRYELFPNPEQQSLFITAYLETATGQVPTDLEVENMTRQVHSFILANHVYWALWAVIQAAIEGCDDFDYLTYGTHRLRRYRVCKDEWLAVNRE